MTTKLVPQNPIILRCHRIMEAFAKSDDERDFYLDRLEGFLICVDLDKSQEDIDALMRELNDHKDRYVQIPKLTFYEVKKLMEAFANEKVYDIDTKEKLLDIIQSKEARENFLEFIYDQHAELEKWQQYYQERFRIRIIEWLRNNGFDFVFEEDVELTKSIVEKVKMAMFTPKVGKDVAQARKILTAKAATYYSNEALNPRPKRGRPPKQVVKVETEPQFSSDIYVSVTKCIKPFLFSPDYHSSSMVFTFSGRFDSEAELLAHRRQQLQSNLDLQNLSQKLSALKTLSANWQKEQGSFSQAIASTPTGQAEPESEGPPPITPKPTPKKKAAKRAELKVEAKIKPQYKRVPKVAAKETSKAKPKLAAEKLASEKLASEKLASEKLAPKKVVPKKTAPKKALPKKVMPKKSAPKKALPKKVTPKKSAPKKALPKKVMPKKTAPKKVASKKVMPTRALSKTPGSKRAVVKAAVKTKPKVKPKVVPAASKGKKKSASRGKVKK